MLAESLLNISYSANTCLPLVPHTQHAWIIQDQYIMFQKSLLAAGKEVPASLTLINNALVYAKELERIV